MTDGTFGNARILDIGTRRIRELVDQRKIVVVAGFQGCDPNGNITTLGRGGSVHFGRCHRVGIECQHV